MSLKIMEEVTVWDVAYRQPNHVYLMSGDKAVAYVPWGKGRPIYFRTFQRIDRRGRKFIEVKKNSWRFDMSIQIDTEPQEQPKPQGQIWTVAGSKGKTYTVNLHNGQWSCSCPGFMFRRQCRHVAEQREKEQEATD
jgi:hypothetical protein